MPPSVQLIVIEATSFSLEMTHTKATLPGFELTNVS